MGFREMFGLKKAPREKTPVPEAKAVPAVSPEKLDRDFIMAACANDVAKMKKLRAQGASIDARAPMSLRAEEPYIFRTEKTGETVSALQAALSYGAFDAALYLAHEKADALYICGKSGDGWIDNGTALDFLVSDSGKAQRDMPRLHFSGAFEGAARAKKYYEDDLFTPAQRARLFDALAAGAENPRALLSEMTVRNTIDWGRAEIIPKLAALGVEITDADFVHAAHPVYRPRSAVAVMEALLPHVAGVNVAERPDDQNAGHRAAAAADLDAFRWLEEKGLDKDAFARLIWPSTYAHYAGWTTDKGNEEKRAAFAQYLVDQGYPVDRPGRDGDTPADAAIRNGARVDVAFVYLRAGAEAKPQQLLDAVREMRYGKNNITPGQIAELGDMLEARGLLDRKTVLAAYAKMFQGMVWNKDDIELYRPVVSYLAGKGVSPQQAAVIHGQKEWQDIARYHFAALKPALVKSLILGR